MNYFQYIIFLIYNFIIKAVMFFLRPIDILTIACYVIYHLKNIISECISENGQFDTVKGVNLFLEKFKANQSIIVHGRIIFALIILLIYTIWN